ncbi:MAG: protocatechuate 3,4-dioxygenase subunit beta [Steroidobacteraceae bacterium]|nr:protocatechuate 3,4-dioxygenase subunit beta [Steroidobacteraceae bacterium]
MNHRMRFLMRRRILQTALTAGGLAAAGPVQRAFAGLPETPMQTMGPFYPITRPLEDDADLTLLKGHAERAQGKVVHLMGRVLDTNGDPVRNAKIELWQANAHGRYAHPADVNPAPLDPNFQGFGIQTTDAEGQYRFKTIKPAAYAIGPMNPDAVRPPHIHFDVYGANTRLVTQMYFPGEPENDGDIIFKYLNATEQAAATATVLPGGGDAEPDSITLRWDIVLLAG